MKKTFLSLLILIVAVITAQAQTKAAGPVERKLMDSLCVSLGKIDQEKITTKEEATTAFMDCFRSLSYMLLDVAQERGIDASDNAAMNAVGKEIGQNLVREKCTAFIKLASKMAGVNGKLDGSTGTTQGTLKRIENKGFNYFVITDAAGADVHLYG
jgi:hypothetical protein